MSIPGLGLALTKMPLFEVERCLLDAKEAIEAWLEKEWQKTPPPLYASVDLRHAGFKLAPVDTNLFPAGFNHLPKENFSKYAAILKETIHQQYPTARNLLLIPESHTRNLFYLKNVSVLQELFVQAGFELRMGELNERSLTRQNDLLLVGDFVPDLIVLNHDLTGGIPPLLEELKQPIVPPLQVGWSQRLKSKHFELYKTVVETIGELLHVNPWFLMSCFRNCQIVSFKKKLGWDCLETHTESLLQEISNYYTRYSISEKPYVVLKTDAGSYGMGVLMIEDAKTLQSLNRKQRKEMATTKGGIDVTKVILQEGIPTIDRLGEPPLVAEPVLYTIGKQVVGGFYRTHTQKGRADNLNTPGMQFIPMVNENKTLPQSILDIQQDRFYVYSVVARLALLAAAREIGL